MKSKQILSIEQMLHLQELGLDTSNASAEYYRMSKKMDWFLVFGCRSKEELLDTEENIPAYTLQDVLDALPEYIYDSTEQYLLEINMFFKYIRYSRFNDVLTKRNFDRTPIIDAAYELLCWVLTNKYIQ